MFSNNFPVIDDVKQLTTSSRIYPLMAWGPDIFSPVTLLHEGEDTGGTLGA